MTSSILRALVVDDEADIRTLVTVALRKEGFACTEASDGLEAQQKLAAAEFDVVITDLRMPNRHGHALAVDLLGRLERPLIVVHTGMLEPKLTKDLLARGVDDVVFKPVNYAAFAGKVKALVQRRPGCADFSQRLAGRESPARSAAAPGGSIRWEQIEKKLQSISHILPISQTALDAYQLTCGEDCEAAEIAKAIERDASLAVELLRIGNSTYYNPAGTNIDDLEQIVLRIGRKRIGELALATNALASLTSGLLPWLDIGLAWRRSVSAGIAVELLIDRGGYRSLERGLLLSASMHALGRVILGTLFPQQYEAMLEICHSTGSSLQEQERRVFPKTHAQVMAHLLEQWNVSSEVFQPLQYIMAEQHVLDGLPNKVRTQVELVRLAVLIGRIAAVDWEPWDTVDLPSSTVAKRLGVSSVEDVVASTRRGLENVLDDHTRASHFQPPKTVEHHDRPLTYCRLMAEQFDFLAALLPAWRYAAIHCAPDELKTLQQGAIVNCVGTSPRRLGELLKPVAGRQLSIVCDQNTPNVRQFSEHGRSLCLPASCARLKQFFGEVANDVAGAG